MKKTGMALIFGILFLVGCLSGCATYPPQLDDIEFVSKDRLYDQDLSEPSELRSIPVKITRDVGYHSWLLTLFLKIDGNYVVWLEPGEEITIYLEEGGYVFELERTRCLYSVGCTKSLDVTIKKGFDNNFRIIADTDFILQRS